MDIYTLHIPSVYLNPDTNETTRFLEGQEIVLRYNSPVKRGIAVGIGKLYFENKGYNYDSHPNIPKAEFLLVNANSSDTNTYTYSEFINDYYYQAPIQITPFDTEYNGKYKAIKIDLNLSALFDQEGCDELDFSHIIFSVPNPSYELTVSEVLILEESYEPNVQYGSMYSRVWQYTEVEMFTASANPEEDLYQLALENSPLFYPDTEWLDYLNIFDEDGNYYTAGITGDDHQLHFEPSNNTFTWNPSFNQYPEYFGMEFEEPLMIEPNKTLYFGYVTNTSWVEPILIEAENIDLDSIRVIYDYNYLLKPEFYDWYAMLNLSTSHSYENIAYSFKEESEYKVVQYYYEEFTVYNNASQYTHTFDIGELSFENDFVNLSIFKVIGLTPTLETEILTDNDNFTVEFNMGTKELIITDLNSENGFLNAFDQITAILNYSYGPISSFSEIYLLPQFNTTYLTDPEESFYSNVDIDYNYLSQSGTALFGEGSEAINSEDTSFAPIDFCGNPDMSTDYELNGYGSELFDNFEIYQDESSIIYVADVDMDGEPDYKHTIDVNKDGKIDVIRYGLDDPQGSGEIYWHTVIQDFENQEINVKQELEEEKRTEWFDIDDRIFAYYDFNVLKLLAIVLTLPLVSLHIAKMMLPDVDYWAQKSTQRLVQKQEYVKSSFYSVTIDNDRDGYADFQINYERTDVNVYYDISEHKKTILAAKHQDVFTYLGEYVAKSIDSLFTGSRDDLIFNDQLNETHLESSNFSSCNSYTQMNADVLRATYRKYSEYTLSSYIDTLERSTLTVIDWNEGEIDEQRIYTDDFENGEIENADDFFSSLSAEHSVTDIDTGQEVTVDFDSEFPYTHPANISWDCETWGPDQVPIKYDSLQVIGEDYYYTTNVFEKEIIIRIPNRYSLYNDFGKISRFSVEDGGWVEFKVKGMLITPPDGQVYYTSDVDSFVSDSAKISGHYFYVDSDLNGFFETVYILNDYYSLDASGTPVYTVMSIGVNYDGIHDFVPYERLYDRKLVVSNFETLAQESVMFESDWIYNFKHLKDEDLLKETKSKLEKYNLKPKDQIFEIYKLVQTSEHNSEFSKLFYEIRHKTYSTAWEQYKEQLIGDIAEQVFMSVTASLLSAAVEAIITGATVGIGWPAAKAAGVLTYLAVYTLMTKFYIDIDLAKAEAEKRSQTFYSVSSDNREPSSLNEKNILDRVLGDSMAAALIGHPGGYYTEVSGGEPGSMYTGQLLVSPPNLLRMWYSFEGFLDLLWENFWNMGESDPDVYAALDFDDINLDYFLLTSELPSYNQNPYYTYENADGIFDLYNMYALNTLGYLETQVKDASSGQFDAIRATCIDGRPQYEFINSTLYQAVRPQNVLYRPIVLSQERYDQLQPAPGRLVVNTRCKEYSNTYGIDLYAMSDVEREVYEAKVPLNDNGFEYPIRYITIDVVKYNIYTGFNYFVKGLIVNESDYSIDLGNLYFTKSIEAIISEKYSGFENFLSYALAEELIESKIYYNIHIVFDVFIPDTTEESSRLALAQATSHTIMDYFNQYVFAETTANSISEITYTETMTFWSTLISAPLVYFGSWAVSAGVGKMFSEAGANAVKATIQRSVMQGLKGMIFSPIQEVFQEIIEDGFIEALAENIIDIAGGTDDLGFWVSSFATSVRETTGALGQLTRGDASIKTTISLIKARMSGDTNTFVEIKERIEQNFKQKKEAETIKLAQMSFWDKMIKTGFLKGLFMVMPSILFGSFSFVALSGVKKMMTSSIELSPLAYGIGRAKVHAYRKGKLINWVGTQDALISNLQEYTKKPAELEAARPEINEKYKATQNTEEINPPLAAFLSSLNPNPKQNQRNDLFNKLKQISLVNNFQDLDFAVETFQMLYPDGYGSFKDPILGLGQWGRERGLDTSHLSFWGGLPSEHYEGKKGQIRKNEERVDRYDDYSATLDIGPVFPSFTPGRETTINDFLTKDLKLTERILGYNIYVNGKEIDLDFWSDFAISPGDKVILAPYIGLLEEVHAIEAKIMVEGSKRWDMQQSLNLGSNEIKTLYEFYSRLVGPMCEKVNWQSGTPSKYAPHFKFLIDESIRILVDNNVINRRLSYLDRVKLLSKIVSRTQSENMVKDNFNELKRGDRFDFAEDYLIRWYAAVWYEIEKAYDRGDILSSEDKNIALYELEELSNAQYKLYGVGKPSKVYLPMKQAYEKLRTFIYKETNICPDKNEDTFNSVFHFNPHWRDKNTYINPDYIPKMAHWSSLCSDIISELKSRSLDHLVPVINSIEEEIFDIIIYNAESLLADKPNWAKKELIENIIDCPETNILKIIGKLKDLSFILFNHPDYGISGGKTSSYLSKVYFDNEGIRPGTIDALLHRISTLTINDFKTIGLGDKLDDTDLKAFKEHAKEAVFDWVQKYGLNSYEGVGTTYRTKELRDLQLETFRALWKSAAYQEDNFFISYRKVSKTFGLWEGFYYEHITSPKMIGDTILKRIISKLDKFITRAPSQNNDRLRAFQDAKDKLIELQKAKQEAKDAWFERDPLSWFDGLFEPSGADPRYTGSFLDGDSFYKAWLIVMGLFELFGTDPMTGEPIPNAAFDKNDKSAAFADHHMERDNKMSNALYDIILTYGEYHMHPYESFSELNGIHSQRLLKYRLQKLYEIGFNKDEVKDNIQNKQWITKADFRAMFPDNLQYEVEYEGVVYKGSLYYLWNDVFTERSFQDKLTVINNKITRYREAIDEGINPNIAVLSDFHPAAESRFLKKASKFADRFWMLGSKYSFSGHSPKELARIWQVYLMKVAFDLD